MPSSHIAPRAGARGPRLRLAILAGAAIVIVAACGSAATPSPTPTGKGGTVDVTLQEFAIIPDVQSVEHGSVTFNADNVGPEDVHELVILKTDLGHRDLPTDELGKVDENAAGIEVIGEIEEFGVGQTESGTYDLEPGKYVLICNIVQDEPDGTKESHYREGMSIEFTVK